jgi:outer membrane protein assembly factor BamB
MLNSFNALSAERASPPSREPDRLEKGPAYSDVAKAAAGGNPQSAIRSPQSDDWPTYRHDAARSGAASSSLSPGLTAHWQRALPGPLTAVVVAGGRLYVAQREAHTVHALSADDGSPLWQYAAGGRVDSPPTIHGGRVYFGSADGWIYCLRAKDGALAWRFRVAPESRQIVSYGQLESVWPVHGNVLVCKGPKDRPRPVAYAAAGRSSYVDGGVYLCGVDAGTGELVAKRRISHRDPKTGREPQKAVRGVRMPGAMPDVLTSDGSSLFMRHSRFDLKANSLPENVDHLFSSVGFLDGTWWHRTYFQLGTVMGGGYGGWTSAGNSRISGRLLVKADDRVFGFGRKGYTITGSHLGLQSEYHLFAADTKLIRPKKEPGKRPRRRGPRTRVRYLWSKAIPFYPRAMVLAGKTLFVAGPSDVNDLSAPKPGKAVWLWAVSAADGSKLAESKLTASPVYDSFAVCGGRLYLATVDARVACYKGR